jgi:asparagine synthase (glutamine-hydrolysing)
MSAICGVAGIGGRPVVAHEVAGVLRALRALGPGDEGTWEGGTVALGACGTRPVRSADGALCAVADAVLDCRRELHSSLRISPAASDAELILAAYERWGDGCLDRLSGEFAFAVADSRRGGVLIVRDQTGVRPLQVHSGRAVVAFATTALSLCALEEVGHNLDRVRVGEWLALTVDTERTFVQGVLALPAGHCAWIDADGMRRRRYWSVDPNRIVELHSPEAYATALRDAFDSAVERRLPGGEPVGVLLSGGLDSTSVAATAARLRPDVIRTYTAAPPPGWSGSTPRGQDADESELVRELSGWHPNLRPAFVSGDLGPLLATFDHRFAAGSPPPRNPANELWMAEVHRRAARDGVLTLLTGTRGNAFFSGDDPFWLAALLSSGRLRALGRELAALGARRASRQLAAQLLPPAALRVRSAVLERRAGITAAEAQRFAGPGAEAVVRQHARDFDPIPRRSLRERMLQAVEWSGFISEAAAVRDALSGVRRTDPTGDIRVIAVAATQPPWARRRNGVSRAVVRDAMADRLPPSIVRREQRGAQLPDWYERVTPRRGELADELGAARESATCRELLDLDRIETALRAWPEPSRARAERARTARVYRDDLMRALLMSRYLRFFDAHSSRAQSP